jgi:hypothetical protein
MVETMSKRRASGKIDEEHVCIDSFIQHLIEIGSGQGILYCDNSENRLDPPDFWVKISGFIYAVEVTSIVNDYGYEVLCNEFFEDIRSEFATNNIIKGRYSLSIMRRPRIPKKGTSGWKTLISTIATSLQDMANAPCGTKHDILKDKNGGVGISKLSDQGAKISPSMGGAKWGGEIREELSQRINERIETKRRLLEKKGVLDKCANVILLFYDAYCYGEIEDMRKAFLNVQGYEWVHSIFIAVSSPSVSNRLYPTSPGRKGVFLYTRKEDWR